MLHRDDHLRPARRLITGLTAGVFAFSLLGPLPAGAAPGQVLGLPAPGAMVLATRSFAPALIRGIQIHPNDPLKFNFLIDPGDSGVTGPALRAEANKMIKYFLAALTVPEDQIWVNLSPYEGDRMVGEALGRTEMGRDLLAQDYLLKQLSASLLSPDEPTGKDYWQRVYRRAQDLFGTTQVPVDTFNKIWVVPQEAVVYEDQYGAYVGRSHLQVMLEADYLALEKNAPGGGSEAARQKAQVTADVVREVLLPEIEREVNEGETFANLRQMYHAMILAAWYKTALKESLLGQVYADQGKTRGVDLEDPSERQAIYDQYLEAFRVGVYDAIKEDLDPVTKQVLPRRYFSGGFGVGLPAAMRIKPVSSPGAARELASRPLVSTETMILDVGQSAAGGHNALQGAAEGWAAAVADIPGSSPVGTSRSAWADRMKDVAPEDYQTDKRGLAADNDRMALALHYVMKSLAADPFHLDEADRQAEYLDFFDRVSTRLLRFVLTGARLEQDTAVIFSLLYPKQQQFVRYLENVRDMSRARVLGVIISLSLSLAEFEELLQFIGSPQGRPIYPSEIEAFVRWKFSPPEEQAVPKSPPEIPERLSAEQMSALLADLPEKRGLQLKDLSFIGRTFILDSNVIPTVLGKDDVSLEEVLDVFDRLTTRVLYLLSWGANLANLETILPYLDDQQRQVLDEAGRDTQTPIADLLGQFLFDSLPGDQRVAYLETIPSLGEGGKPRSSLSLSEFIREQGRPDDFRPLPAEAFSKQPSPVSEDGPPAGRGLSYADMDPGAWGRVNFYFAGREKSEYVSIQERLDFLDRLSTHIGRLVLAGIDLEPAQGIMAQLSDEQLDFIAFLKKGHPAYSEDTSDSGVLADLIFLTLPDRYQNLIRVRPGGYDSAQVDSVVKVLKAHPDILRPSQSRSERQLWADLARERGGGYLTGLRGLTLEGMPALPEDRREVLDPVAFVEKFFRADPAFAEPAGGARDYLEFLDQLSTRLMQFVLDGARLRQDAEQIIGLLSEKQRAFINYVKRSFNKDNAQGLAVTIFISFSQYERRMKSAALGKVLEVEEIEALVRMMYGRLGLNHLPSRTMVEAALARLPATREMDYERLSPDTKNLVDNVIPLVYEMGPDSREEVLAVVGALSARVFALLGWGADLETGELDWMMSFLEGRQQQVLKQAAEIYDMDPAILLADIVLAGMPEEQRADYLKRIPRGGASFEGLREFVADLDRPEQVSSPVGAERGETTVVAARLDEADARERLAKEPSRLPADGDLFQFGSSPIGNTASSPAGREGRLRQELGAVRGLLGLIEHFEKGVFWHGGLRAFFSGLSFPENVLLLPVPDPDPLARVTRAVIEKMVSELKDLEVRGDRQITENRYGMRTGPYVRIGHKGLGKLKWYDINYDSSFLRIRSWLQGRERQLEQQLATPPLVRATLSLLDAEQESSRILDGVLAEWHQRPAVLRFVLELSGLGRNDVVSGTGKAKWFFLDERGRIAARDGAVRDVIWTLSQIRDDDRLSPVVIPARSFDDRPFRIEAPVAASEDEVQRILDGPHDYYLKQGYEKRQDIIRKEAGRVIGLLASLHPGDILVLSYGTVARDKIIRPGKEDLALDAEGVKNLRDFLAQKVGLPGWEPTQPKPVVVEKPRPAATRVVLATIGRKAAAHEAEAILQGPRGLMILHGIERRDYSSVRSILQELILELSALGQDEELNGYRIKKKTFTRGGAKIDAADLLVAGALNNYLHARLSGASFLPKKIDAPELVIISEEDEFEPEPRVILARMTEAQAEAVAERINTAGLWPSFSRVHQWLLRRFILELSGIGPDDVVSGTDKAKRFFTSGGEQIDLENEEVRFAILSLFWSIFAKGDIDTFSPVVIPDRPRVIVPKMSVAEARIEAERLLQGENGLLVDGYGPIQQEAIKKELTRLVWQLSGIGQDEQLYLSYGRITRRALTWGRERIADDAAVLLRIRTLLGQWLRLRDAELAEARTPVPAMAGSFAELSQELQMLLEFSWDETRREGLARNKETLASIAVNAAREALGILRDTDLTLEQDADRIIQLLHHPDGDEWLSSPPTSRARADLFAQLSRIKEEAPALFSSDTRILEVLIFGALAPWQRELTITMAAEAGQQIPTLLKGLAKSPGRVVSSPLRILVVDDSQNMREIIKGHLEEDMPGAAVDTAGDGEEALAKIRALQEQGMQYDLIMTDRQMPKMDGFDLAEKARADGFEGKIILMSAFLSSEHRQQYGYLFQGMFDKNDVRELMGAVQRMLVQAKEDDGAVSSAVGDDQQVGGIDLNAGLLDLQIRRDGRGVPLPLPQQPIEDMHIEGFIPVIINMTPVPSLPLLLGLATGAGGEATTGARTSGDERPDYRDRLIGREPEELSLMR